MLVFTQRQRALLELQRRRHDRDTYTKPLLATFHDDEDDNDFFHNFNTNILPHDNLLTDELNQYASVRAFYDELVVQTALVSHRDFWQRYYYRTDSLDRVVRELAEASGRSGGGNTMRKDHPPQSESTTAPKTTAEDETEIVSSPAAARFAQVPEVLQPDEPKTTTLLADRPSKESMKERLVSSSSSTSRDHQRRNRRQRESVGPLSLFSFVLPQMSQITPSLPDLMPATTMESQSSSSAAASAVVSSPTNHPSKNDHDQSTPPPPVGIVAAVTSSRHEEDLHNDDDDGRIIATVETTTTRQDGILMDDEEETTSSPAADAIVFSAKRSPMTTLMGTFFGDHCRGSGDTMKTTKQQPRRVKSLGSAAIRHHPRPSPTTGDMMNHRRASSGSPLVRLMPFLVHNNTNKGQHTNHVANHPATTDEADNDDDDDAVTTTSPIKTVFVPKATRQHDGNNEPCLGHDDRNDDEDDETDDLTNDDDKPAPAAAASTSGGEVISLILLAITLFIVVLAYLAGEHQGVVDHFVTPYYNGLCAPYIPSLRLPSRSFAVEAPWWAPGWHDGFRIVCGDDRVQTRLEWDEYSRGKFRFTLREIRPNTDNGHRQQKKKQVTNNNNKKRNNNKTTLYQGKRWQSARVMANEIVLQKSDGTVTTIPAPWQLQLLL
jgi:hypothetical protein